MNHHNQGGINPNIFGESNNIDESFSVDYADTYEKEMKYTDNNLNETILEQKIRKMKNSKKNPNESFSLFNQIENVNDFDDDKLNITIQDKSKEDYLSVRKLPENIENDFLRVKNSFNVDYNSTINYINNFQLDFTEFRNEKKVGPLTPLSYLIESTYSFKKEFKNEMQKKYDRLKKYICNYRTIYGDGNCFYRAVIFRYIELLVLNKKVDIIKSLIVDIYNSFQSNEIRKRLYWGNQYLDPQIIIVILLVILHLVESNNIFEAHKIFYRSLLFNKIFDYLLILYLRYIIYLYIKQNESKLYLESFPVLIGNLLPSNYEKDGMFDYNSFYENYLLKMFQYAEKIIIYMTPFVLGINLHAVLFDDNEDEVVKKFGFAGKGDICIDDAIYILNKRGHYENIFSYEDNQKFNFIYYIYKNSPKPNFISIDNSLNINLNNNVYNNYNTNPNNNYNTNQNNNYNTNPNYNYNANQNNNYNKNPNNNYNTNQNNNYNTNPNNNYNTNPNNNYYKNTNNNYYTNPNNNYNTNPNNNHNTNPNNNYNTNPNNNYNMNQTNNFNTNSNNNYDNKQNSNINKNTQIIQNSHINQNNILNNQNNPNFFNNEYKENLQKNINCKTVVNTSSYNFKNMYNESQNNNSNNYQKQNSNNNNFYGTKDYDNNNNYYTGYSGNMHYNQMNQTQNNNYYQNNNSSNAINNQIPNYHNKINYNSNYRNEDGYNFSTNIYNYSNNNINKNSNFVNQNKNIDSMTQNNNNLNNYMNNNINDNKQIINSDNNNLNKNMFNNNNINNNTYNSNNYHNNLNNNSYNPNFNNNFYNYNNINYNTYKNNNYNNLNNNTYNINNCNSNMNNNIYSENKDENNRNQISKDSYDDNNLYKKNNCALPIQGLFAEIMKQSKFYYIEYLKSITKPEKANKITENDFKNLFLDKIIINLNNKQFTLYQAINELNQQQNYQNCNFQKTIKEISFELKKQICLYCYCDVGISEFRLPCGCNFCCYTHLDLFIKEKVQENISYNFKCFCSHEYKPSEILELLTLLKNNNIHIDQNFINKLFGSLCFKCGEEKMNLSPAEIQGLNLLNVTHFICKDCIENDNSNYVECSICKIKHQYYLKNF